MADIALEWGSDFYVSETGDLAVVDQADELRQRVIRRLLTNSAVLDTVRGLVSTMPDNLFEPTYGGNARAYVDATVTPELIGRIEYLLRQQLTQEPQCDVLNSTVQVDFLKDSASIVVSANIAMRSGAVVAIQGFEVSP